MKDGVWPVIMQCIIFIISLAVYVIYSTLIILYGYIVGVCTFIVEFIQHTAGPFIASIFYYLFLGLFDILAYCYAIMMTVLHYVTAAMLRVIQTLLGAIQPLALDVVYYGSDIVAMVISNVFNLLTWMTTGLFSITVLIYNTVSSLFINGLLFMKDGVWPVIMQCIIFIISLGVYVMHMIYNTLTILCGYIVDICTFIVEFIQHTAGPFVASVFYYLFLGLFDILAYCYAVMMTVLHYVTAAMLRVIQTLLGAIQPLALDVVYYGSDIVAMVISNVFNLLTWMTTGLFSITVLIYNTVSSLFINGLLFIKNGIWLVIMRCIIFINSLGVYVMNMIYNTLTILYGYIVDVCTFIVEFMQHTAGPFIASVFYYLFLGLFDILAYFYAVMMTVLHYVTAAMLRIIPGAIQPLALDVVYYGSDIVAMVISNVFNLLTWMTTVMMKITELSVVTPAFWALLLAAVLVCCLYCLLFCLYYTKRWAVREEMLCVVCLSEKKMILLQPCNHLCLCVNCVDPVLKQNRICPMCRKDVRQWIKVYL